MSLRETRGGHPLPPKVCVGNRRGRRPRRPAQQAPRFCRNPNVKTYNEKTCHPERGFIRVEGSTHCFSAEQTVNAKILRFALLTQDDKNFTFCGFTATPRENAQ